MINVAFRSDVEEALKQTEHRLLETLQQLLEEAALTVASEAKKTAPKRTGFLAASIGYRVLRGSAEVAATAPYASYVEYGTKPHMIYPKRVKVLIFRVGGKTIFSKRVQHPGSSPQPFMRRAVESFEPNLRGVLATLLEEVFKR